MIRLLALALSTAAMASVAFGPAAAAQSAVVRVVSDDAGAVTVDDRLAEAATPSPGIREVRVAAGARRIALVDDPAGWNPRRAQATLTLAAGDTVTVELRLPMRTRVESLPLGATLTLVLDDGTRRLLGESPAVVDLPVGQTGRVVASMEDHVAAEVALPAGPSATLILRPVGAPEADPVALLPMRGSTRGRTLIDLGIGAAALAAGALAVHYKFRADRLDDEYRNLSSGRRGEESLRQDIVRNDRLSTGALVGMQVGLGVLAVRFILR